MTVKYDLDDISIIPEPLSSISSRKNVNPFDFKGMLPLFAAPMDTVVNLENITTFEANKIYAIPPRGISNTSSASRYQWNSYGLDEFIQLFIDETILCLEPMHVLIDIANGHMSKLLHVVKLAKEKYGKELILMVGNIANPSTYKYFAELGVDYIRCGIGGGAGCTTAINVAINYPMGSLIQEIYEVKKKFNYTTKIVADGGMKKYADIIKCLALGADYVMVGSLFNKALESAGAMFVQYTEHKLAESDYIPFNTYKEICRGYGKEKPIQSDIEIYNSGVSIYKKYRGMSTKEVQQSWGKTNLKTAEGISKMQKVEYTLAGWVENFEDYLRSAMSYTSSEDLESFKESQKITITQNSFKRFNK